MLSTLLRTLRLLTPHLLALLYPTPYLTPYPALPLHCSTPPLPYFNPTHIMTLTYPTLIYSPKECLEEAYGGLMKEDHSDVEEYFKKGFWHKR